ncbi:MAG: methylenetetrahydrofolate reductase C-terminal domain-containing protein [Thermodesulfovibrionales bacterium]|nr:methylenetetrahydrofolate reductase C-terminal domain-containing protein [Thermodesulfovibrionales bacterium]MDP3111576.1 methylenetetrahydrofolate reductase C-terminal domain-containing protein [Thermodesulfovibrionales bacterium]
MIITKKRDFKELMENIKTYKSFFLLGCSECATLCGTGGEPELKAMKETLEAEGKTITGTFVAKTGCQVLGTKVELKPFKEALDKAECIIVMSCGAGTQSAVELYEDKPVYASNDSMFLGNMTRLQFFDERCSLCGKCILDKTGGICPITACPKGLLNGPCGGCKDGHCEISPDIKCAWVRIYERMKKLDRLQELCDVTLEAKDWSASQKPRTFVAREEKKK